MTASKQIVDAFEKAVSQRPFDFKVGEHTVRDTRTKMTFWICNGFFSYGVWEPYKFTFNPWQAWRFSRLVKQLKGWIGQSKLLAPQEHQ